MTESITTPNALVQSTNGKRFYVNSGLIGADNTETTILDINNIGERDIILRVNPILTSASGDNMTMKLKNNGTIIYQAEYIDQNARNIQYPISFIIPANTSIEVTFTNSDTSVWDVGVSCYGEYLSM